MSYDRLWSCTILRSTKYSVLQNTICTFVEQNEVFGVTLCMAKDPELLDVLV